jgi:hypothetical protein
MIDKFKSEQVGRGWWEGGWWEGGWWKKMWVGSMWPSVWGCLYWQVPPHSGSHTHTHPKPCALTVHGLCVCAPHDCRWVCKKLPRARRPC